MALFMFTCVYRTLDNIQNIERRVERGEQVVAWRGSLENPRTFRLTPSRGFQPTKKVNFA
jgi:hypothetical protein